MRNIAIILIIFFTSCSGNDKSPDVSSIKIDLAVQRFEKSFFSVDTSRLSEGLQELNRQFPSFFRIYANQILHLPIPGAMDPQAEFAWKQIISGYRPVFDSLMIKYRNMDAIGEELEKAFAYVKHYYPQYSVPKGMISYIATFDAPGIILTPEYIGVGLHQFAGKNFSVYQDPQLMEMYPAYISRRFDREYIVPGAMKAVAEDIYADSSVGRPLIEQMIEKGKQWYLLDHFLPKTHDSLITGYTRQQLDWTESNEGNIWGFITSNNDIYSIDPVIIQDFIGEAPFTRGMPEGFAPGNIGQWVGWRIVQKYAERNSELSLEQILATPATTIFQNSRYKPK